MAEAGRLSTLEWAFADPWRDRQGRNLSHLALPTIAEFARLPTPVEEVLQ